LLFGCHIQSKKMSWMRVKSLSYVATNFDSKSFYENVITFFDTVVEKVNLLRYMMDKSIHAGIVNIIDIFMTKPTIIKETLSTLSEKCDLYGKLQAPLAFCLGFAELGTCCNRGRRLIHINS